MGNSNREKKPNSNFDEALFLEFFNIEMKYIYLEIPKFFHFNTNVDILVVKKYFREQISNCKSNEEKKHLNLAYEYLFVEEKRKIYNSKDENKFMPFKFSPVLLILSNNLKFLKNFLKQNSQVDFKNSECSTKRSFIYLASKCGYSEIVKYLLKRGTDPNIVQNSSSSALHAASYFGHLELVSLLMDAGADWRIKNDFGNLPEDEAYSEDIKEIIESYKNEKAYTILMENLNYFEKMQIIFDEKELVGKRYTLKDRKNYKDWDLGWHGTLIKNITSILKNGLRPTGEIVDGKEIDIRNDTPRIDRRVNFQQVNEWSEALFSSSSRVQLPMQNILKIFPIENG